MKTNRPGFTLIELLIAAAIGVLVIAAVVAAFAGGLRVWERARSGTSPAVDAAVAIEWLQRDLHNSTPTRLIPFEGAPDWVHVPALVAVTGAPTAFALQSVTYTMPAGRHALTRSAIAWPGRTEQAVGDELVEGLDSVRFSYQNGEGGDWLAAWTGRTNRPSAVGVTFQFKPDRGGLEVRRTMLIPGA